MRMPLTLAVAALAATALSSPLRAQSANEWTSYGRDAAGTRNSPLTQVTPGNVSRLAPAWTYRTGEFARADEHTRFEATPLMVDGTLYLSTPFGRAIALDPATGRERWTYDAHVDATNDFGDPASRGVSTWLDPRAKAGTRAPAASSAPSRSA
jgi:quinoprotein glucose dehydrogenase